MGNGNSEGAKKFYVADEVAPLRVAGIFGPPGIEAYLAQGLPKKDSLYLGPFNVAEARKEFASLDSALSQQGVEVLNLRALFGMSLDEPDITAEELLRAIEERYKHVFGRQGLTISKSVLESLLHEDAVIYGESAAVAINHHLSMAYNKPLGNIHFARDQSNVLFDNCFLGSMTYAIRQPEVMIVEKALNNTGYRGLMQVTNGVFEGGDAMIIGGCVYIGTGIRTTPEAARQIASHVWRSNPSVDIYMVSMPRQRRWEKNMEIMHLDTYTMPVDHNKLVGCIEVMKKATIENLKTGEREKFIEHFAGRGFEIYPISAEEQRMLAANMITIAPGKVLMSVDGNSEIYNTLKDKKIEIIYSPMKETKNGAGAGHCMIAQFERF